MGFLEHDKCEDEVSSRVKLQHSWDDADEPVSCEIDRHVSEQLKLEVKKTLPRVGDSTGGSTTTKRSLKTRLSIGLMR